MQNPSLDAPFSHIPRIRQKTEFHCGPAVLSMQAAHLGMDIDQERFVMAAGVDYQKLKKMGMTVNELGLSVTRIIPEAQFWYKSDSRVRELYEIVMVHHYPVGVEWQGDFYSGINPEVDNEIESDEEEDDDDSGHYSLVTYLNTSSNTIFLADPYKYYAGRDRRFSIREFENRWWDINEIIDSYTGGHKYIKDNRMMFIITPAGTSFPEYLGMTPCRE